MRIFLVALIVLISHANAECQNCASGFCVADKCCDKSSGTLQNGVMVYNCFDNDTTNDGHSSGGNTFPQGPCPVKKCSDCYDRKVVRHFPKNGQVCEDVAGVRDALGVCRYEGERYEDCDWPRQVCYLGECRTRVTPGTRGPGTRGHSTRGPGTEGPNTRGPRTRGPMTEGPNTRGPGTEGPSTEGPNTRGPRRRGPGKRAPGNNGPGDREKTPGGPGKRDKTPNGPGTKGPSTEGPGTRGPGTEGPETRGPDTEGPGTRGPQTRGPRSEGPGTRGPSTEGPNTRGPRTRGPSSEGPGTENPHWCSHRHQDFHGVKCTGRWRYRPGTPTCVHCRNNGPECCMLANDNTKPTSE